MPAHPRARTAACTSDSLGTLLTEQVKLASGSFEGILLLPANRRSGSKLPLWYRWECRAYGNRLRCSGALHRRQALAAASQCSAACTHLYRAL